MRIDPEDFNQGGDPTQAVKDLDRGKMFSTGRNEAQHHYYNPEICQACNGKGWSHGNVPNKEVPGKSFDRPRKFCKPCKGRGYLENWINPTIRFFCVNRTCRGRFVIDLDVRDIIKGLQGFKRNRTIDNINYSDQRECPFCHSRLRPWAKQYFWRWDAKENRWVTFHSGGSIRRV